MVDHHLSRVGRIHRLKLRADVSFKSMIVRGFPSLLALFVGGLIALTFLIRYRYLARYTQLKEPALPPPSPPTLAAQLLPLSTAGLSEGRHPSAFHNYLDDFLAAIRIFGYLEKPVFHELSRHLQTRRLAAGETLEIGGGDFWCVVEGKVQVVRSGYQMASRLLELRHTLVRTVDRCWTLSAAHS